MKSAAVRTGEDTLRERRCIVTGEVLPDAKLVRFVADPDGNVVPDVAAELPGRGMWVNATREAVKTAVARNLFAKSIVFIAQHPIQNQPDKGSAPMMSSKLAF